VEAASIVGIVRATEIRVAPEVGGHSRPFKIQKGDQFRAGDSRRVVALELTASVGQRAQRWRRRRPIATTSMPAFVMRKSPV